VTEDQRFIEVDYKTASPDALFDICDINGRILKTGKMSRRLMRVAVSDLIGSAFVFLILDGEHIHSRRFTIAR
jgi:hypothetical protein